MALREEGRLRFRERGWRAAGVWGGVVVTEGVTPVALFLLGTAAGGQRSRRSRNG